MIQIEYLGEKLTVDDEMVFSGNNYLQKVVLDYMGDIGPWDGDVYVALAELLNQKLPGSKIIFQPAKRTHAESNENVEY